MEDPYLDENDSKEKKLNVSKTATEFTDKEICLIVDDNIDEASFSDGNKELVNLDYLKYELPIELLKAFIYNKHKYELVKIELICGDLTKTTGMSWNKRFKNKYGPIEKFLRKNDDIFDIVDNKYVKLKEHLPVNLVASSQYLNRKNELIESCLKEVDEQKCEKVAFDSVDTKDEIVDKKEMQHWFDFNDSHITPMKESQIEKQYEGNMSCYI